jgi:hypothetical protein
MLPTRHGLRSGRLIAKFRLLPRLMKANNVLRFTSDWPKFLPGSLAFDSHTIIDALEGPPLSHRIVGVLFPSMSFAGKPRITLMLESKCQSQGEL